MISLIQEGQNINKEENRRQVIKRRGIDLSHQGRGLRDAGSLGGEERRLKISTSMCGVDAQLPVRSAALCWEPVLIRNRRRRSNGHQRPLLSLSEGNHLPMVPKALWSMMSPDSALSSVSPLLGQLCDLMILASWALFPTSPGPLSAPVAPLTTVAMLWFRLGLLA